LRSEIRRKEEKMGISRMRKIATKYQKIIL